MRIGDVNYHSRVGSMSQRWAVEYIDRLIAGDSYNDLAQLSSAICSTNSFSLTATDYGLPQFAFVFVETLHWEAQATRSGVWTYYEATPVARQDLMKIALQATAPESLAEWYERGASDWKDEDKIAAVDDWIEKNDESIHEWLHSYAVKNRDAILALSSA